jgi:hypothetical protein
MKTKMLEKLKEVLRNTSDEDFQKDWESLSEFSNVGPLVSDVLISWKLKYSTTPRSHNWSPKPELFRPKICDLEDGVCVSLENSKALKFQGFFIN